MPDAAANCTLLSSSNGTGDGACSNLKWLDRRRRSDVPAVRLRRGGPLLRLRRRRGPRGRAPRRRGGPAPQGLLGRRAGGPPPGSAVADAVLGQLGRAPPAGRLTSRAPKSRPSQPERSARAGQGPLTPGCTGGESGSFFIPIGFPSVACARGVHRLAWSLPTEKMHRCSKAPCQSDRCRDRVRSAERRTPSGVRALPPPPMQRRTTVGTPMSHRRPQPAHQTRHRADSRLTFRRVHPTFAGTFISSPDGNGKSEVPLPGPEAGGRWSTSGTEICGADNPGRRSDRHGDHQ